MTLLKRSLVMISIPTIAFFLIMMVISSNRLKFYASEKMKENLKASNDAASEHLMGEMQKPCVLLEALTDMFLNGSFETEHDNLNVFTNLTKSYADSTGFYGVIDGVYYDGTGWEPDSDWNPVTRPWYTGAVADPEHFVYSDVYIDAETKSTIVSISKQVFDKDKNSLGVVSVDFPLDSIKKVMAGKRQFDDEKMFILTNTGFFASHEKYTADDNISSIENGVYSKLADKFLSGSDEIFSVKTKDGDYYYKSTKIKGTSWYFIYGRSENAANAFVYKTIQIIVLSFLILLAVIFVIMIVSLHGTAIPIKLTANALSEISSGAADLTRRIEVTTPTAEMKTVVSSFNGFAKKLQGMIGNLKDTSSTLNVVSQNMKGSVSSVSNSMTEIRLSIKNVREQIQNQANGFDETSNVIKDVAESIANVNEMVDFQTQSIRHSSGSINELVGNIEQINRAMETMASSFSILDQEAKNGMAKQQKVNERITLIEQQSQMLQEANSAIAAIASQTNLLAMNAAIEAAHAGEAGQGFAVVADEIRKLSETSSKQSKTIGDQLKNIKDSIVEIVTASQDSSAAFAGLSSRIQETDNLVHSVCASLETQNEDSTQVISALQDMDQTAENVRSASAKMAEGSNRVLEQMDKLRLSLEAVQDSMTEMTESVRNVAKSGMQLDGCVEELDMNVTQLGSDVSMFKTA